MAGNNLEEAIQHIMELTNEEINSIELSHTSKGAPSWKIKKYYKSGDKEKAIMEIDEIDKKLKEKFK